MIELLDKYATAFPLLTIALLETLVVSWLYGMQTYISLYWIPPITGSVTTTSNLEQVKMSKAKKRVTLITWCRRIMATRTVLKRSILISTLL